tara:strand:+ start:4517 stop:5446 length:930 start_codon:yes stop_codon:yes gene_type:complete
MKIKKVLVVLGGNSRERNVSLDTGKACIGALKNLGYKVVTFDPSKQMLNEINKLKVDVIFNALHGKDGEDGNIQSYFEYLKIPYTHSGVISSMTCMDKEISKEYFKKYKILTPKFFLINKYNFQNKNLKYLLKKNKLNFPIVVKPTNEGSSIGVKICKNYKKLQSEIKILIKVYDNLMIEKYIGGQEIQVAVMNGKSLGAIELKPKRGFYDYKAKYYKSAKTEHILPANISKKNNTDIKKISEKVYKILNCRGVTRCDFKLFKNKFYLLEINTQPGMTDLSLVPEIARFKGISFNKLIEKIISDASLNK